MTFKRVQIIMVPVEKAENCFLLKETMGKTYLRYYEGFFTKSYLQSISATAYHLYFLLNEKVEKNEWCFSPMCPPESRIRQKGSVNASIYDRKIIATTDTYLGWTNLGTCEEGRLIGNCYLGNGLLFKPLLPKPSNDFVKKYLEEYNKGNIIKWVDVEFDDKEKFGIRGYKGNRLVFDNTTKNPNFGKIKINSKNEISITKIKDNWTKEEIINTLIKYREDYETFKKSCHFGPNEKEINQWSNSWIEKNL